MLTTVLAFAASILALVVGARTYSKVLAAPSSTDAANDIASAISQGATAFLNRQYRTVAASACDCWRHIGCQPGSRRQVTDAACQQVDFAKRVIQPESGALDHRPATVSCRCGNRTGQPFGVDCRHVAGGWRAKQAVIGQTSRFKQFLDCPRQRITGAIEMIGAIAEYRALRAYHVLDGLGRVLRRTKMLE